MALSQHSIHKISTVCKYYRANVGTSEVRGARSEEARGNKVPLLRVVPTLVLQCVLCGYCATTNVGTTNVWYLPTLVHVTVRGQ